MCPKKLTDKDKKEILSLYRHTNETTSSLAETYGMNSSSVSRFLKNALTKEEYDLLIAQKRKGRKKPYSNEVSSATIVSPHLPSKEEIPSTSIPQSQQLPALQSQTINDSDISIFSRSLTGIEPRDSANSARNIENFPLKDLEDLFDQDDIVIEDLQDEIDADARDSEEIELPQTAPPILFEDKRPVHILPKERAEFPQICYLVINLRSELITRPLKDFIDLGHIPTSESEQLTLPVFDNHFLAKRFSHPRSQRVIKIPNSSMLEVTSSCLIAKGITRLLFDGQVFSLPSSL